MKYYIYKIVVGDKIYVGSSKHPDRRWKEHKASASKPLTNSHFTVYTEMREYGVDNCHYEIIEEIECETKRDSFKVEQYHINLVPNELSLNDKNAYTTYEERKLYNQALGKIRWNNLKYDPDHILKRQKWNLDRYNRLKQDPQWVMKKNERNRLYEQDQCLNNSEEYHKKYVLKTRKWREQNPDKVKAAQARCKEKYKNDPEYRERKRLYMIEYRKNLKLLKTTPQ